MKSTLCLLVALAAASSICTFVAAGRSTTRPYLRGSTLVPFKEPTTDVCTLEDKRHGHCVHSYLCVGGHIVTDGSDLADERTLQCKPPLVCCLLSEEIKETTTTPRTSTLVNGIPTPPSGPGTKCQAADNSTGRCLYPHLCTDDSTVVDGDDLVDERSSDPCPSWRGAIQICCPAKYLEGKIDVFTESPPVTPPVTVPNTDSRDGGKDEVIACTTRYSALGSCVPLYQCVSDDEDGANIINVRFSSDSPCSFSRVCCPVEKVDRSQRPVTPPPPLQCGTANPNGLVYRDITGNFNEAKYGEFPWMVAVRSRTAPEANSYNISGGSIIHPWVVLTAAHYVVRAQAKGYDVRVRAGEWNLQSTDEPLPHQEQPVRQIRAHPDFNKRNKQNDIALLFLQAPFQLAPHVGVVCLPPPARRAQPSTDCVANGWGQDKFGTGQKGHSILKKTILPVMAREECQIRLRNTRLGPFYQLHSGFMCAGGERLDTCTQDGGGPLACPLENDPNRYVLSGIVSWGIGCGQDGVPGVYMEVAQYTTWIRTEVLAEGYDLENFAY